MTTSEKSFSPDGRHAANEGVWLTIIVLGYNAFDRTSRLCLDSLSVAALPADVEVLLIDNGSSDDSAALSRAYCQDHPRIRFHEGSANLGFAGGMNLAVELANGSVVLLCNSDIMFPPGAIDALRRVLNAHNDFAVLGLATNAAGNAQGLPALGDEQRQVLDNAARLMSVPTGFVHAVYRVDFVCVAVKKTAWQHLGGLDTGFGRGYYEDFDFSLRACAAGYAIGFTEDVIVFHAGSQSFAQLGAEQRALIKKNKRRLQALHPRVRFPHRRDDNLRVLEAYAGLIVSGQRNAGLEQRLALRIEDAKRSGPRSMIKRFMWRRRLARALARLDHARRSATLNSNAAG